MLDVLLLPYKWNGSDEDALAGFNTQSLKRLRLNIPLIFVDADYHEHVIFYYYIHLDFIIKICIIILIAGQIRYFRFNICKYF